MCRLCDRPQGGVVAELRAAWEAGEVGVGACINCIAGVSMWQYGPKTAGHLCAALRAHSCADVDKHAHCICLLLDSFACSLALDITTGTLHSSNSAPNMAAGDGRVRTTHGCRAWSQRGWVTVFLACIKFRDDNTSAIYCRRNTVKPGTMGCAAQLGSTAHHQPACPASCMPGDWLEVQLQHCACVAQAQGNNWGPWG